MSESIETVDPELLKEMKTRRLEGEVAELRGLDGLSWCVWLGDCSVVECVRQ